MIDREQIKKDLRAGFLPVREIARRAGCSVRTVYRIQTETGSGAGEPGSGNAAATEKENALSALSAIISYFENYYKTEV